MKKIFYLFFFILTTCCTLKKHNIVDSINPIRVSFKDEENKIQLCHPVIEAKAIVSVKLEINNELKIASIDFIDIRYKTIDNKSHRIEDKTELADFFNNKGFSNKISIKLINKNFNNYPYFTTVSFPVYLKNCSPASLHPPRPF